MRKLYPPPPLAITIFCVFLPLLRPLLHQFKSVFLFFHLNHFITCKIPVVSSVA